MIDSAADKGEGMPYNKSAPNNPRLASLGEESPDPPPGIVVRVVVRYTRATHEDTYCPTVDRIIADWTELYRGVIGAAAHQRISINIPELSGRCHNTSRRPERTRTPGSGIDCCRFRGARQRPASAGSVTPFGLPIARQPRHSGRHERKHGD